MTTNLIRFPRPEGRPSNAALQSEVRALRHAVATISDERDELDAELTAWVDERVRAASETVALARRGRMLLDAGRDPRAMLDAIATLNHRERVRALSARTVDDQGGAA